MRSKKALLNIACSLLVQGLTVVSAFIIPRLLISTFQSSVNGLTVSITQFLGYLVLLQSGVGGVVKASLYKPLAQKDIDATSGIIKATENFFRKIAYITIVYVGILAIVFPFIGSHDFGYAYTFLLVLIIGIGTFAQYYFGITYQMLLQADQKNYIYSIVQMASVVVHVLLVVVLVRLGAGIHIVKLGSSLVFLIRPILLNVYVKRKYNINNKCNPDKKSIAQRWDGFGHTIAYFIHNKTDIFLLTLLSNLREVSVYSVYVIVTNGLKTLVSTIAHAVQAAFGNMIAKEEYDVLNNNFKAYECFAHMVTVTLFTSAAVLVIPFISIYTKTFTDINYIRPVFAYLIIAAEGMYCLRQPYHSVIISAGHYKQTRNGAFIEAAINILVSLVLIQFWGIIGVAAGTLLAMLFRTFDYAVYLNKNILFMRFGRFIKRMCVSILSITCTLLLTSNVMGNEMNTYFVWAGYAVYTTLAAITITLGVNLLFYRKECHFMFAMGKRLIFSSKKAKGLPS